MSADEQGEVTETLGVVSLGAMVWKWIRRRSLVQWGLLAAVGLSATTAFGTPGLIMLGVLLIVVGAAVLGAGARPRPAQRRVTASLRGLHIEGRAEVPSRRLLGATIAKVPDGYQVDIVRRFGAPIRLVTPHPEQARRVIDALGLGLDRRVFQSRLLSPIVGATALVVGWGVVATAFAALAFSEVTSGLSILVWFCAMLAIAALSNVPTRLRVGRDGVETRWLWRRRSHRISELSRLEVLPRTWLHPHRVRVHRRRGASLDLPISQRPKSHPAGFEAVSRVIERIEAAMHASSRDADPRFGEWNRSRAVLGPERWLAALRAADGEYREAAMPFDGASLLEVLDDPHAPIEDRAGAAVAVGARADDALKARLLDISRSSALPELVQVIEAVRAGDEARLLRALERVPRVRIELPTDLATPHAAQDDETPADAPSARARLMR